MKRWFGAGLFLGAGIACLVATVWNAGFEALPPGSELASNLDTRIQEFKAEVRKRLAVENIFGNGSNDNGLMREGSARGFTVGDPPTDIWGPGQYNSAAGSYGGTALGTTELGGTRDLGTGRFWIDDDGPDNVSGTTDDNQLNVWSGLTHAWMPISSKDYSGAGVGGINYLYNGSFENTDGTGLVGSTSVPLGWTLVLTPTIGYSVPAAVEGKGFALSTTATGAGLEGVQQALSGLKASTTYVVRVRALDVSGVLGGCTLKVFDGTTTKTVLSKNIVWEPLETLITTTAVPATVNVQLLSTADTNVCQWDLATVFEQNAQTMQAGVQVCRSTDTSTAAAYKDLGIWDDAQVACRVTPPGPGYIIEVRGKLVANHTSLTPASSSSIAARLQESGATVAMATASVTGGNDAVNDFRNLATVPLFFTRVNPTPGTTLTYTMSGTPSAEGGGAHLWERNMGITEGADDLNDSANMATTLEVVMIPTR